MADDRRRFEFPLTASHFSATFLDFQRNSRGYEEQFDSADLDATKRLLSPFLPKVAVSIPQCHRFGNAMWSFAKECTAVQCPSRTQGSGFNPPSSHLESEEDLKNTSLRAEEPSRSSVFSQFASKNEPITCAAYKIPEQRDFTNTTGLHEATNIKTTSNGADQNQNTVVSEVSSSQNEDHHFPDCLGWQTICEELCQVSSKLTSTGAVSGSDGDMKSSLSENHIFEQANLESSAKLSTNTHPQLGFENRASIGGDVESKHNNLFSGDGKCSKNAKNVKTEESVASKPLCASDVEFKDISNGPHCHDGLISEKQKSLTESIHKEHPITPLPLYKQRNYNSTPISTRLTVNLNLDALLSVLDSKQNNTENAEYNNVDICGKVAILYGFQQNATVSVLQTEMVGLYDYTLGTVYGLQQEFCHDESESQDMKCPFLSSAMTFDLEVFLTRFHQTMRAQSPQTADSRNILKEHSPVAWLLTSPALGVTLDWQVQEKLLNFVETLHTDEVSVEQESSVSNNDFISTRWYNLLVVIDEYRYVEKDIPLVEVYKLGTSGEIKLVNFDLN